MNSRKSKYCNALVLGLLALLQMSVVWANEDQFEYDVYIGDLNNDGVDDIYLSAKETFIPIHGSVIIPLFLKLSDRQALLSEFEKVGYSIP